MLVHRGGNIVLAPGAPGAGAYLFTVLLQRGARIEWVVNYQDDKNHVLYQIDKTNFNRVAVGGGKRTDAVKVVHLVNRDAAITLQIEVTAESIKTRIQREQEWFVIDELRKADGDFVRGRFGFRIPGRDQIALQDFRFTPK